MRREEVLQLAEMRLRKEDPELVRKYVEKLASGKVIAEKEHMKEIERHCGTAVLVDMSFIRTRIADSLIRQGLVVEPLAEAISHRAIARETAWSLVSPSESLYTALVAKYGQNVGMFIHVPPGVRIEMPMYTCMLVQSSSSVQLVHNVIVVDENAELRLLTGCLSSHRTRDSSHISVTEIIVRKNARLYLTMIHSWNETIDIHSVTKMLLEEGAEVATYYVSHSPVREIEMSTSVLLKQHAKADLASTVVGRGSGKYSYLTETVLEGPEARSVITSRAVSYDVSIVKMYSRIVGKAAHVRGHVECLGLVLSSGSRIVSIPELEAQRDDVELSHEAAIGKISEDELLYLMARGLSEDEAKSLIVKGFLKIEQPSMPEAIRKLVDRVSEELLRRALV